VFNKINISPSKQKLIVCIVLVVVSCAAFGRIAGNDFVALDDEKFIYENYHVQSGINSESIKWAATAVVDGNWHPLTFISHMLAWSLFGSAASGHHLINLLLHIGAVIFLFLFLNKTTNNIWPSAFTAAFFALHPLRVESVAWAAERKDVLSMFFAMATLYAYAFYVENAKISRYFLCLLLFALSLMSKQMMVTLPFLLLLLDYWPMGRWQKTMAGKLIGEKIPFLCLTIAASILAFWTQNNNAYVISLNFLPFTTRVANALVSYAAYLGKTFWPVNLAAMYSYDLYLLLWKALISGIILIIITLVVLYYIRKLPFLFVGWFWFLGTLVPVIGLVQLCMFAMADRYSYLPSIGIGIMLAWGIPFLMKSEDMRKKILFPVGIAVLAILAVLTWKQCGYWKNTIVILNRTLEITHNNYLAHGHFASVLFTEGKTQEAIDQYSKAISIMPGYDVPYYDRGIAYYTLGRKQRAIEDFEEVIRITPNHAAAYYNMGIIYLDLGRYQNAIENYSEAIRINPDDANAYNDRALAYLNQGKNKSGCRDAQKACAMGVCKVLEWSKNRGYCR
jgi:protein O-mannosyl-transferase